MLRIFKRYYSFLLHYKWRFAIFTVVTVIGAVLVNIQPYFYKRFVDEILLQNYDTLKTILYTFIGITFLGGLMRVITYWVGDYIIFPASEDVRVAAFKKIQELDFAFHTEKNTGSLISMFKRGDSAFFDLFHQININIVTISIQFTVLLYFFGNLNSKLVILMIISFAMNLVLARIIIPRNIKYRKTFNKEEDRVSGIVVDNLINFETVKYFGKEEREQKRLRNQFKPWHKALMRYANTFRDIDMSVTLLSLVSIFFVIMFSLNDLKQGLYSASEFVLILSFITTFFPKLGDFVYQIRNITKHYTDLYKYMSIFDEKVKVLDPKKPKTLENVKGVIDFKNMSFTYKGGETVFKNLNLHIKEGESIALVGKSGTGKTTLVKLLLRFFDIQKGEIILDGINIKDFKKSTLRSYIGVVPQEPVLFNNTIGFNISYGDDTPTKEEVVHAAELANLRTFIESLPKKYETEVGERGIKLSGGQKQRLAIARMLLAKPEIIVFDEATSNLDSESERLIQDAFWKVAKNRTTIIIAHRFSTIMRADRIIVMEKGKIVEQGKHEELVKKGGVYSQLWSLQVDGVVAA